MSSPKKFRLVAFGEVLWDCLPGGLFLGGAPLNVAYHASQSGAKCFVASSVGRDFLGDEALRRMKSSGLEMSLVNQHGHLPTGVSIASLNEKGDAAYEILRPVAWDEIEIGAGSSDLVEKVDAFVYGTLSARSSTNVRTLDHLLKKSHALKVCDVNLRAPFDARDRALRLARFADVLKVNDEELETLCASKSDSLEASVEELHRLTGVETICVTLGEKGAFLWKNGEIESGQADPVNVADTIGAGDSFTAALTMGLLEQRSLADCLHRALELSAFVASKNGAQPNYDWADVLS